MLVNVGTECADHAAALGAPAAICSNAGLLRGSILLLVWETTSILPTFDPHRVRDTRTERTPLQQARAPRWPLDLDPFLSLSGACFPSMSCVCRSLFSSLMYMVHAVSIKYFLCPRRSVLHRLLNSLCPVRTFPFMATTSAYSSIPTTASSESHF